MHCKSYSHFFSKKFQHICVSLNVNFNESLTNDIFSFEQLGLDFLSYQKTFLGAQKWAINDWVIEVLLKIILSICKSYQGLCPSQICYTLCNDTRSRQQQPFIRLCWWTADWALPNMHKLFWLILLNWYKSFHHRCWPFFYIVTTLFAILFSIFIYVISLNEIMDTFNFIDGRFHFRNSGVKGLNKRWYIVSKNHSQCWRKNCLALYETLYWYQQMSVQTEKVLS